MCRGGVAKKEQEEREEGEIDSATKARSPSFVALSFFASSLEEEGRKKRTRLTFYSQIRRTLCLRNFAMLQRPPSFPEQVCGDG